MNRPLLVIDGDSFAHRAYHALPKSIRRKGNKGAGAIVGFGNFLVRLYDSERPRAVVVGWDTLDAPTHRQQLFAGYQAGRSFDDELIEQLGVLPEFVAACGFSNAKAPGFEADDFLAAAVAREERRGRPVVVASGDRDAYQLASELTTILQPIRAGEMARIGAADVRKRYGVDPPQVPDFIALRGDPSDKIPGGKGRRPSRRREPATEVSHTRTGPAVRPVPPSSRRVAPLSEACRHGQVGAAAVVAKPKAEVVGGSEARSRMAAKQACGSAGTAQRLTHSIVGRRRTDAPISKRVPIAGRLSPGGNPARPESSADFVMQLRGHWRGRLTKWWVGAWIFEEPH